MKRIICFILCITISLMTTGCWDQKIYEKEGFALTIGYDLTKSDKILMTFVSPVLNQEAKEKIELIYTEGYLLRKSRDDVRKTSAKSIEGGKIQQFVISEGLAKKGFVDLLDIMERESNNPTVAYILISKGSSKDFLKDAQKFNDKPMLPFYINELIENNIYGSYIPKQRVFEFTNTYFALGIDPILPMVKLQYDKGKGIECIGSALFSGEKMVGEIDTTQTPMLLAMMNKFVRTTFVLPKVPDKDQMGKGCALSIFNKPKRKISVKIINNKPVVDISLKFQGSISEFKWNGIKDIAYKIWLENIIAAQMKSICDEILRYTQKVNSDPIGIGDIVRAKYNSYWNKVNWKSTYKDVTFNVNIDVNILDHGIIK